MCICVYLFIESFVSIWMLSLQLTLTTYLPFSHSFSSLFLYFPFHPNRSQSEHHPLESGSAPGFFRQGGFSSQLWPLTCSVGLVSFSYVQNALRRLRKWFTAWRIKISVDWLTDKLLHLQLQGEKYKKISLFTGELYHRCILVVRQWTCSADLSKNSCLAYHIVMTMFFEKKKSVYGLNCSFPSK